MRGHRRRNRFNGFPIGHRWLLDGETVETVPRAREVDDTPH